MNESITHQPDRLPEGSELGRGHGFDHNNEYKIWGSFTGQTIYDQNSNFVVPEFRLSKYELITDNPGFFSIRARATIHGVDRRSIRRFRIKFWFSGFGRDEIQSAD